MLSAELESLVHEVVRRRFEFQNIELKRAGSGTPQKLYDTLSSFSNQEGGGIIIFGIDEENDYEVTGVYDVHQLQKKVTEQALQMVPAVRPMFTVAEINGRFVVSAEIAECDITEKPCYYRGKGRSHGSYIRVGEADLPMTEFEIYSYEVFRRKLQDELRTVPRADFNSFDRNMLTEYFVMLRKSKPNLANQADEKILQLQGMIDQGVPTLAGLVVLGEYPQAYFPQLSVIAVAVDGTEIGERGANDERFVDNQRIEGPLGQMLDGSLSFVRRNTRCATIVDQSGKRTDKTEYPMTAVREIVLNALIHRDYSIHTDQSPIRIAIYRDRLEVESPGGLYGRTTISDLGKKVTDTRNPFVAGAMEVLSETENRFSGIPTIIREAREAGLPPPEFSDERGTFRVVLRNSRREDGKEQDVDLPLIMQEILDYCTVPRTRREIADHLKISTVSYVMSKYITPLIKMNRLHMTIPDVPRSRNQKYISANVKNK